MTKKTEIHAGALVVNRMMFKANYPDVATSESHHKNKEDPNFKLAFTPFSLPGLVLRWLGPGTADAADCYWEVLVDDGILGVCAGYVLEAVNG